MSYKSKPGPRSIFDETHGNGIKKNPRFPIPVWEVLQTDETRNVLNAMALSEEYKQKVWSSVPPELDRLKKNSVKSNDH